jgi:hypothetical protein
MRKQYAGIMAGEAVYAGAYTAKGKFRHCKEMGLNSKGRPVCLDYSQCPAPQGWKPQYRPGTEEAYVLPRMPKRQARVMANEMGLPDDVINPIAQQMGMRPSRIMRQMQREARPTAYNKVKKEHFLPYDIPALDDEVKFSGGMKHGSDLQSIRAQFNPWLMFLREYRKQGHGNDLVHAKAVYNQPGVKEIFMQEADQHRVNAGVPAVRVRKPRMIHL